MENNLILSESDKTSGAVAKLVWIQHADGTCVVDHDGYVKPSPVYYFIMGCTPKQLGSGIG